MATKTKKSKNVSSDQEETYYMEAEEWNDEKYRSATKHASMWRRVAFLFGAIALLEALGFAGIAPLKTAVPYVIKVDQSTGIVEIVEPLSQGTVPQDEALTKYWIVQYLNAREQYDSQSFEHDSYKVSKMSSSRVFNDYSLEYAPSQESSPFNLYGEQATITIHVQNISFLDNNTAVIHMRRSINKFQEKRESHWAVTLSFKYLLNPKTESDRFVNPLGFQITKYRKDPVVIEDK